MLKNKAKISVTAALCAILLGIGGAANGSLLGEAPQMGPMADPCGLSGRSDATTQMGPMADPFGLEGSAPATRMGPMPDPLGLGGATVSPQMAVPRSNGS